MARYGAPQTIVLDADGYRRHVNNGMLKHRFTALAQVKNFLFLGMSMNEAYLLTWLQEIAGGTPRHIYVCDEEVYAATQVLTDRHSAIPAVFSSGAYDEVDSIIAAIFGGVA